MLPFSYFMSNRNLSVFKEYLKMEKDTSSKEENAQTSPLSRARTLPPYIIGLQMANPSKIYGQEDVLLKINDSERAPLKVTNYIPIS